MDFKVKNVFSDFACKNPLLSEFNKKKNTQNYLKKITVFSLLFQTEVHVMSHFLHVVPQSNEIKFIEC